MTDSFEVGAPDFGWKLLANGPAPGDFNWDDTVDFGDFLTMSSNFGSRGTFAQGDINGNGSVDLFDFVEFVPLLPPQAAPASVPEPGSLSLVLMAAALLFGASRRRVRR